MLCDFYKYITLFIKKTFFVLISIENEVISIIKLLFTLIFKRLIT